MIKKIAMIFGALFMGIGLLGFVPGITSTANDGTQLLIGIFQVDPIHNAVHIVTGLAGLVAAGVNTKVSRAYLIGFGMIYALIAFLGFFDSTLFGLMRVNLADNWLHAVLAAGLLGTGLIVNDEHEPPTPVKNAA